MTEDYRALKRDIEFHLNCLRRSLDDERFNDAIIHYYKILMNKFYRLINEDKAKKLALSSLNSLRKASTEEEFEAVLSSCIKDGYISQNDWNEYQAKRSKSASGKKESEENESFLSLLEV